MKLKITITCPRDTFLRAVDLRPGVKAEFDINEGRFVITEPGKVGDSGELQLDDSIALEVIE